MMRALIIYQTTFGSNKRIAQSLEAILDDMGHDVVVKDVRKGDINDVVRADITIFSSPTHIGNAPRRMRRFLKRVASSEAEGSYVLISTAMADTDPEGDNSLKSMADALSGSSMSRVGSMVLKAEDGLEEGFEDGLEGLVSMALEEIGAHRAEERSD